jgi:hypothetical protein
MKMMFRSLCRGGVALMLLAASLQAVPQQATGRYTVEILVFRADAGTSGEDGAAAAPLRSTAGDIMPVAVPGRRLAGAAAKLRSAGYRILAHTAWSQMPAAWNSRRGVSVEQLGVTMPGLSGNVVLERGQFLHLGLDLKVEEGGRSYVLADLQQVKKLGEAQYFDHPQLGAIALVTSGGPAP